MFDNKSEVISGIPGSGVDHDKAPYCLTEEFVSVYRLHSLIPDNVAFFNIKDGQHEGTLPIVDVSFESARKPFDEGKSGLGLSFADVFYSFGVNYPGAIRAHNMPNFLRDLKIPADKDFPEGRHLDLGTIDILRDRERGVPRYNAFRRLFHMPAAKSFIDLTGGDDKLASELEEVYEGDLEAVDLLVGTLCEPLPKGFGFSDTAFRVFILMATRRIKSDRFIAGDGWCPEVYTREGMDWVQKNTMKDVLCRHFPELAAPLHNVKNVSTVLTRIQGLETNCDRLSRHGRSLARQRLMQDLRRTRQSLEMGMDFGTSWRKWLFCIVFLLGEFKLSVTVVSLFNKNVTGKVGSNIYVLIEVYSITMIILTNMYHQSTTLSVETVFFEARRTSLGQFSILLLHNTTRKTHRPVLLTTIVSNLHTIVNHSNSLIAEILNLVC